tara:strand:- start:454 stop:840 length:387 start_codon:yes stop_codon:yes gene_type:complete
MENNNPLSPHLQIYKWHISSLISIATRITGIINILAITLICIWFASLLLGESNYKIVNIFLQSFLGKFLAIGITWSFSFQILSEIRHLVMDLGYGFEIKTTNITGIFVIIFSFILTILIYLFGRQLIL